MNEQTSYDQELMSPQVQTESIHPVEVTVEITWLQSGYSEPLKPWPVTSGACWLDKREVTLLGLSLLSKGNQMR